MNCAIGVTKTKALISCAVTAQLICAFVLALAKIQFSHDAAKMSTAINLQRKPSHGHLKKEIGQIPL